MEEDSMYDIVGSIVVFKNDTGVMKKAIESFSRTSLKSYLYVIDNSPIDDLRDICTCNNVEYIFNNKNLGFGAGHNIAIRKMMGRTKYSLILNPDVYFNKGTLENLFNFMEENEEVGSVTPKILYPDGSIQYLCKLLPTPYDLILRRFIPFKKTKRKRTELYELKFTGYNKVMEVPYLSGCFMFIRTEVLKKVGLFDENIFIYLEDVDLCRRIHKHYKTIYYPKVSVYHQFEKGSYESFRLLIHHIKSAIYYFNKWGWFFDKERKEINRKTLEKLN